MKDQPSKVFKEYQPIEDLFKAGEIHPLDLKDSVIAVLDRVC